MLRKGELSLKDRVLRSPGHTYQPFLCRHRPHKYQTQVEHKERFARALKSVQEGGVSVRRAAEEFSIPKSTLHDHLTGKVVAFGQSGPPKYLTDEEEEELEEFLSGCASVGFARSRQQVLELVQELVNRKGYAVRVSHGWWDSFRRRHPNLTLRTASPLSYARVMGSDPTVIRKYYDLLERTLSDNHLLDKPAQIFNLDETGMPLNPSPPLLVATRGLKNHSAVGSGDISQITVLACCSASGYVLPPFVILDRLNLKQEFTGGEVPGTVYGLSKKGWIDGELFEMWFSCHFLAHAPPICPILLLMDGHSSHYQPSAIRRAAEEGIIMFLLPPHTSHLTQPLDKGCFGPLKVHWKRECWEYLTSHPGQIITRHQFSAIFRRAWSKSMTMTNVIAGFRVAGVYPLNRLAVVMKDKTTESLAERTGLKFIPLYSPSHRRPQAVEAATTFEPEEISLFQTRFEEGYDLEDERYESWLRMYHPEVRANQNEDVTHSCTSEPSFSDTQPNTSTPISANLMPRSSLLSRVLVDRAPSIKYPEPRSKGGARVLTSAENIEHLNEKERKKEEATKEKQKRKEERERKKVLLEEERERKKLERERKKMEKAQRVAQKDITCEL